MSLLKTLAFILGHPLNRGRPVQAFKRLLAWQVGSRLAPGATLFEWVGGAKVVVRPGDAGFTQNIYCGLHEFEDMAFVLHALRPGDLFVDVGANMGSYTVLACAGNGCRGVCFEPLPEAFRKLELNVRINGLDGRVRCLNCGVGDAEGELVFTVDCDTSNHVLLGEQAGVNATRVKVLRLDTALAGEHPVMMKVDVEGFETAVLLGATEVLASSSLHSLVLELNGHAKRYGFDEDAIVRLLKNSGFEPVSYDPFARRLTPLQGKNAKTGNTLFVRDVANVMRIVKESPHFQVHGLRL